MVYSRSVLLKEQNFLLQLMEVIYKYHGYIDGGFTSKINRIKYESLNPH